MDAMAIRIPHGMEFFEHHSRSIPVKYGDNPSNTLGDLFNKSLNRVHTGKFE